MYTQLYYRRVVGVNYRPQPVLMLEKSRQYQHLVYDEAGHIIGIPYWPTAGTTTVHSVSGERFSMGGTPAGNAFASADSWRQVLLYLENAFR